MAGSDDAAEGTTAIATDESDDGTLFDLGLPSGDSDDPSEPCGRDLDIVFVMDVTSSMAAIIDELATEIDGVDATLQALELPSSARYGLVVFVDDVALLYDGAAYPDLATLRAEFETWSSFTTTDAQIGGGEENFTYPENSLDALFATTGFAWRPASSTTRIVIHTTDDTFWNGPGVYNGVMVEHGYDDTVDALQDEQIRVFTFASPLGDECDCTDVSAGWFAPYQGRPSIPTATDGDVFDLDEVIAGNSSLSAAIEQAVLDSVCDPYEPVG